MPPPAAGAVIEPTPKPEASGGGGEGGGGGGGGGLLWSLMRLRTWLSCSLWRVPSASAGWGGAGTAGGRLNRARTGNLPLLPCPGRSAVNEYRYTLEYFGALQPCIGLVR